MHDQLRPSRHGLCRVSCHVAGIRKGAPPSVVVVRREEAQRRGDGEKVVAELGYDLGRARAWILRMPNSALSSTTRFQLYGKSADTSGRIYLF